MQLAVLATNQVETRMGFPLGTAAVRFTAADRADREGAAEEAGGLNDLCQAGAASALAIGELRAAREPPNLAD